LYESGIQRRPFASQGKNRPGVLGVLSHAGIQEAFNSQQETRIPLSSKGDSPLRVISMESQTPANQRARTASNGRAEIEKHSTCWQPFEGLVEHATAGRAPL
jgi:hypothetical protein